jgi:hypothetical protein
VRHVRLQQKRQRLQQIQKQLSENPYVPWPISFASASTTAQRSVDGKALERDDATPGTEPGFKRLPTDSFLFAARQFAGWKRNAINFSEASSKFGAFSVFPVVYSAGLNRQDG